MSEKEFEEENEEDMEQEEVSQSFKSKRFEHNMLTLQQNKLKHSINRMPFGCALNTAIQGTQHNLNISPDSFIQYNTQILDCPDSRVVACPADT